MVKAEGAKLGGAIDKLGLDRGYRPVELLRLGRVMRRRIEHQLLQVLHIRVLSVTALARRARIGTAARGVERLRERTPQRPPQRHPPRPPLRFPPFTGEHPIEKPFESGSHRLGWDSLDLRGRMCHAQALDEAAIRSVRGEGHLEHTAGRVHQAYAESGRAVRADPAREGAALEVRPVLPICHIPVPPLFSASVSCARGIGAGHAALIPVAQRLELRVQRLRLEAHADGEQRGALQVLLRDVWGESAVTHGEAWGEIHGMRNGRKKWAAEMG